MAFMADLACFDSATAMPPLLRIAAASWECHLKLAGLLIAMCYLQHCFRLILQLLMCLHASLCSANIPPMATGFNIRPMATVAANIAIGRML